MRKFVCDLCDRVIGDGEPVYVVSIEACYSNGLHSQKISSNDYCHDCQVKAIKGVRDES